MTDQPKPGDRHDGGSTWFIWLLICLIALSNWLGDRRMSRLEKAIGRIEKREAKSP